RCGAPLPKPSSVKEEAVVPEAHWTAKCPVCKSGQLKLATQKKFLGLQTALSYKCPDCGATFSPDGSRYKLTAVKDKSNPVWQAYRNKRLTEQEWKNIASGGLSSARQHEADIEQWLTALKEGEISVKMICDNSQVLLKRKEELEVVLPDMALWEPRSVRQNVGGYGGPSFRIAKGVSWRLGAFKAQSESHEELRAIDQGRFTLTNKRLVFSGAKRTVDINLNKIISIEPYSDGIAVRTSGRQKAQYFVGIDPRQVTATVAMGDRVYQEPFTGLMLQCLIKGLVKRQE
ncbi:MAG: hypothetical protein J7K94_05940, partial [Dehalococcoidia bacterium]|nr:hypothetical protein [Dehalococcoidia bacterium]